MEKERIEPNNPIGVSTANRDSLDQVSEPFSVRRELTVTNHRTFFRRSFKESENKKKEARTRQGDQRKRTFQVTDCLGIDGTKPSKKEMHRNAAL